MPDALTAMQQKYNCRLHACPPHGSFCVLIRGKPKMRNKRILHAALASVLLVGGTAPVFAQGFLDRMKEDAERRAENKAVRDAENPAPAKPASAAQAPAQTTAAAAPAAPAAPAQPASAATPAAPATPAPAQ
jgi:hypothetical protein